MIRTEIIKDMEFLVTELTKEWDTSKETKHKVTVSLSEAKRMRAEVQELICGYGKILHNDTGMSFKTSIGYCRQNYITLRFARKLIKAYEKAAEKHKKEVMLGLDKEEYKFYKCISRRE